MIFHLRLGSRRGLLVGAFGIALAAALAGEYGLRRATQRRLEAETAQREAFQAQLQNFVLEHQQLKAALDAERRRNATLSESMAAKSAALDRALTRLAEEERTVGELQTRLAAMTEQLERLQGELVLALERSERGAEPSAVELERVVVTGGPFAGLSGRVVSVHEDWDFVVVDLGWDAVQIGDVVSIYRNETLVAKARIERVQEAVAAASLLPDWTSAAVQVNDQVRVL